jgi:hypothetical protein
VRWQWDILSTILEGYISHMPVCQLEVSENSITNQLAKAAVQY